MADFYAATWNNPLHMSEDGRGSGDAFVYQNTTGAPIAIADRIFLGKIAGGTWVHRGLLKAITAIAACTVNIGFEARESNSAAGTATSFLTAASLATAGATVESGFEPFRTEGDIAVFATVAGAAIPVNAKLAFIWSGISVGRL